MDFSLSESERDLVGLCRDFAQNEIARRAPQAWEEARCPTDLLREMVGLGLLGMLIPEEWGEIGMSTVGFVAAMEQIGMADQSVAAAVGRGTRPRCVRPDRTGCRFRRTRDPHPGGTARAQPRG
jgi:alkylation response protein AidB-like acyl-CoA dehydrogenase